MELMEIMEGSYEGALDQFTSISGQGDQALQGFQIFSKYLDPTKQTLLGAAEHDLIYGPDVDELINAGITKEDLISLNQLNWMIKDDSFACFV